MTHHQLRLNRCVGQVALDFRDRLTKLESLNARIRFLRGSIRVARLVPHLIPTIPALEFALFASAAEQDFLLLQWKVTQARWKLPGYCGSLQDRSQPLPALEWTRDGLDDVGPQPLEWSGGLPRVFSFQSGYLPRAAAARVEKVSERNSPRWKASWDHPFLFKGTNPL